jgi:hypothetical protein
MCHVLRQKCRERVLLHQGHLGQEWLLHDARLEELLLLLEKEG